MRGNKVKCGRILFKILKPMIRIYNVEKVSLLTLIALNLFHFSIFSSWW